MHVAITRLLLKSFSGNRVLHHPIPPLLTNQTHQLLHRPVLTGQLGPKRMTPSTWPRQHGNHFAPSIQPLRAGLDSSGAHAHYRRRTAIGSSRLRRTSPATPLALVVSNGQGEPLAVQGASLTRTSQARHWHPTRLRHFAASALGGEVSCTPFFSIILSVSAADISPCLHTSQHLLPQTSAFCLSTPTSPRHLMHLSAGSHSHPAKHEMETHIS